MKKIAATAIIALMTTTIGLSAAAPAFAHDAPHRGQMHQDRGPGGHGGERGFGRGMGAGFLNLGNPEAVEISLVRLSHRIDLTDDQQPLFEAFKSAAMAAAEDFASVLEGVRPAKPNPGEARVRPEFSDMLAKRIEVTSAQLAALEAVQPSAAAFFDSLTDEQQAQLNPRRGDRSWGKDGMRRGGPNAPVAPTTPEAPEAPDAPATNG